MTISPLPLPPTPSGWSDEQLLRLESERRQLQRALAYHPYVRIVSMRDDPPTEYEVEYRVRTLCIGDNGQLQYADSVTVRIAVPPTFPQAAPTVRPVVGVFHPNVSWEGFHLSSPWQPTDSLVDLARKIGDLMAWRIYDPETVVNPVAMQWLDANAAMLPLDNVADFSHAADGDPFERIVRHAPATLQQIRSELDQMRHSLLDAKSPPGATDVGAFAQRTRQSLSLFSDPDLPDSLRNEAATLEEWAAELPASVPAWDHVRRQRPTTQALREISTALSEKAQALDEQINRLESMSPSEDPDSASDALATLPDAKALEQMRTRLPALIRETSDLLKSAQDRLDSLNVAPPHVSARPNGEVARQLQAELGAQAASVRQERKLADRAMTAARSVLARAQAVAPAFERVAAWQEYHELFQTARELEQKLAMWGGAGVHACYVENSSGRFGPFQFHQAIELGRARVAVRGAGQHGIEVVDARTGVVLGHSDSGSLTLKLTVREETESAFTFRVTERCDQLAAQFDFLVRRADQQLEQLTAGFAASPSWCGRLLEVLTRPESLRPLCEGHRRAVDRWTQIARDLHQLALLKARVEIWNLLQRIAEALPRITQKLTEERARLTKCTSMLSDLMARCGRDIETGGLIVPPHLAGPYSQQSRLREQTNREIARLERLLSDFGSQVAGRMASRAGCGQPTIAPLRVLPPLPPALVEAVAAITDDVLDAQLARIEGPLKAPLRPAGWSSARPRSGGQPIGSRPPAPPRAPAPAAVKTIPSPSAVQAGDLPDQPFLADDPRPSAPSRPNQNAS